MSDLFENDPKDRKRRFLRGLNYLLGLNFYNLEDKEIEMREARNVGISQFRDNLANFYGLEFTQDEITHILARSTTTGEFTEKYCEIIYRNSRGKFDLNTLIRSSITAEGAIDLKEMDKALKYGLNGSQWCDVAEGPCSCGASHH